MIYSSYFITILEGPAPTGPVSYESTLYTSKFQDLIFNNFVTNNKNK